MLDPFRELTRFGRATARSGLVRSTCGNASLRDGERMLITTTGSDLSALTRRTIAEIELSDGRRLSGSSPSIELGIHRGIYLGRPDVGAVLHCQSRAATLLACLADPPRELDFVPEIPAFVRSHAYVDYATPGSEQLASSVRRAFDDPDVTVVQMRNHGQVVVGSGWHEVVKRASYFEFACWLAMQGLPLKTIDARHAQELRAYARRVLCDADRP